MSTPNLTSLFPRFGEYVEAALSRAKPAPDGGISPIAILELDCVAYCLRTVTEQMAMRHVPDALAGVIQAAAALSDLPFRARLKDFPETMKTLEKMLDALAADLREANHRG